MSEMHIRRVVQVPVAVPVVFGYLADFTTTTEWDPGTVRTELIDGDGGVGTRYRNTSRFLGRQTELIYTVAEHVAPQRIRLRGVNKTVTAIDVMEFREVDGGTEVTYIADFTFVGVARFLGPLIGPALQRLGNEAAVGMRRALMTLA